MLQHCLHTNKLLDTIRALLLGCSVLLSPLANGQKLEEIIVTAQKRAESLQDVSVSVTALSGEKLSDFGIARLEEITAYVPNFVMSETGIGTTIYIRGVGSGINQGFEQSVGMYRDGIYYGRAQLARAPIFDMERVEVLRGPQVTLFGNNSIGGAVSMTAAKPTDEFEGFIAGLSGEHDESEITGVISGPITDSLAARLSIRQYDLGGYLYNATTQRDEPQRDYLTSRLHFSFTPENIDFFNASLLLEKSTFDVKGRQILIFDDNGSQSATATNNYTDKVNVTGQTLEQILGGFESSNGQQVINSHSFNERYANNDYSFNETESATLTLNFNINDIELKSISGYLGYNYNDACDCDFSGASLIQYEADEDYSQTSQEFRITTSGDNFIDVIAGIYYQKDELLFNDALVTQPNSALTELLGTIQASDDFAGYLSNISGPRSFNQDSELFSAFTQFTINFREDFRAIAGVRRSKTKKSAERELTFTKTDRTSSLEAQDKVHPSFLSQTFNLPTGPITVESPTQPLNFRDENGSLSQIIGVDQETATQAEIEAATFNLSYDDCDSAAHNSAEANAGISYERPHNDCDDQFYFQNVITTALNLALNVSPHSQSGNREIWKTSYALILEWDINEDVMGYASRVRGFKSGGFDVRSNNPTSKQYVIDNNRDYYQPTWAPGGFVPGTFEFDDEESLAHEIGIKASIGDAAEVNVSYFYNEIKNLQVSVFDGGVGFNVSNAAEAVAQGVEIDGRLALSENFMLTASLAWLDFEFKNYQDGVCTADDRLKIANGSVSNGDYTEELLPGPDGYHVSDPNVPKPGEAQYEEDYPDYTGDLNPYAADDTTVRTLINGNCKQVSGLGRGDSYLADMTDKTNQYVASYSGSISLMYENEIDNGTLYRAAIDMNFTDSYHPTQNLDESVKQDGYEIYNVRFGMTSPDGRLNLSLIGRNITDEKIISYANDVPLASSQFGTITKFGFLQRTRNVGIQARYNF